MSFRDIIAEVQNLTENEKRQLLELLERDLCNYAEEVPRLRSYTYRESSGAGLPNVQGFP